MDLEEFLAIEKQYGLLEENIDGFFFWIYARVGIEWYIENKVYSYDWPPSVIGFCKKLMLRMKMILNVILHSRIDYGKHDMLVLNSPRRAWVNDHYECIYTDDIVSEMGNAVVLEGLYEQKHFAPVKTPNLIYLDGIEIKAQLYYYFNKFLRKKIYKNAENNIYEKIKGPLKELTEVYNITIGYKDIIDLITPEFFKYQIKKKSFIKIVEKIQPKVILEVCSYSTNCMIINEVAKINHIPVVELQHGVMGREHIAYNYPQDVAIKQFPDYLFIFSDFWRLENRCPIPDKNIISVGFPYMEKQKLKYPPAVDREKTVLLFLSQGMVGKYFAEMAINLTRQLDMNNYQIIFKLHPNEYTTWKKELSELQNVREIEVIDNNKVSLYELFAKADIQIGYTSTAIYEGLSYNLDTYIYTQNNVYMKDLIKLGYAHEFTSIEELRQLINNRTKSKKMNSAGEFWTINAKKNIKDNLNMLINGDEK